MVWMTAEALDDGLVLVFEVQGSSHPASPSLRGGQDSLETGPPPVTQFNGRTGKQYRSLPPAELRQDFFKFVPTLTIRNYGMRRLRQA